MLSSMAATVDPTSICSIQLFNSKRGPECPQSKEPMPKKEIKLVKCEKCGQDARKVFPVDKNGYITMASKAVAKACQKCVRG